jgi:hypothetical protein
MTGKAILDFRFSILDSLPLHLIGFPPLHLNGRVTAGKEVPKIEDGG